jgi:hypothetical protein
MCKFKCCNCGFIIEEEELEKECPKCGVSDWEEIIFCNVCGKGFTDVREMPFYSGMCEECLIDIVRNDGINLEFVNSSKKTKIDFYINYILGGFVDNGVPDDLIEILEDCFKEGKLYKIAFKKQDEFLEDFCEGDLSAFAEWYVEKKVVKC